MTKPTTTPGAPGIAPDEPASRRPNYTATTPPGWSITVRRRTVDRARLTRLAALTVLGALALVVAAEAGLVPRLLVGVALGPVAAAWHLYLRRPVTVIHARPPTTTDPTRGDHHGHRHPTTTRAS